ELRNMIERLVIMTPESNITAADVTPFLNPNRTPLPIAATSELYAHLQFKDARKQFEHDYLKRKLEECKGNVSQTAEKIGLERSHLHKKVKALGIVLK
ncbi:MAG: sigma-54-dependent Fis family transcriptional regulator, partial [Desulfobulbus sp.]